MTVTMKNLRLKTARVLDLNGNASGDVKVLKSAGTVKVGLPRDAMYIVLLAE